MLKSLRHLVIVAAATLLVMGVAANVSHAQLRVLPNSQSIVNPYYRIAPGLPLNQAAYNLRVLGNAYAHVPPWVYGYNPYPSPIITTPYPAVYPYAYSAVPYGLTMYPYATFSPYGFRTFYP